MADFLSSLFGASESKTKKKEKTSATTTIEAPQYIKDASQKAVGMASDQASKPYQAFEGERTAGFDPDQQTAADLIRSYAEGGGATPNILDPIGGHTTQDYLNPYMKDMMDQIMGEIDKGTAMGLQRYDNGAHAANAFGDDRRFLGRTGLEREGLESKRKAGTDIGFQAWDRALGLKAGDLERMMKDREFGAGAAKDLFNVGQAKRQVTQSGLDANYEAYLREQGWPAEMIKLLAGTTAAVPADKTTNSNSETKSTVTEPGPSMFSQIAGPLASVAGAALGAPVGSAGSNLANKGMDYFFGS